MLFNSSVFVLFFSAVYVLYLLLRHDYPLQNRLLLIASLIFYGYWDWRFLGLLILTTFFDFHLARTIQSERNPFRRKFFLGFSIFMNLGVLGFFKYFNFFMDSFSRVTGLHASVLPWSILLPVGISFYTFQEMSYVVDVYRREIKAADKFSDFALFVSFFPQLVAGPIEKARNLLPQILSPRRISPIQVEEGIFLVLWGYFKKLVVADNLGLIADRIFNDYHQYHGMDLVLALLSFTFQIYCDFSGYCDIGRGIAKLLGFELMCNFDFPYFSRSPREFWTRWHISLSQWFRDYLYIPLGGNRKGHGRIYINLILTMIIAGLWHGAAWNFLLWGAYHGFVLAIARYLNERSNSGSQIKAQASSLKNLFNICCMFLITTVGWVFFRCRSIDQIFYFLGGWWHGGISDPLWESVRLFMILLSVLLTVEISLIRCGGVLAPVHLRLPVKILFYGFLLMFIFVFSTTASMEFIYFQF